MWHHHIARFPGRVRENIGRRVDLAVIAVQRLNRGVIAEHHGHLFAVQTQLLEQRLKNARQRPG